MSSSFSSVSTAKQKKKLVRSPFASRERRQSWRAHFRGQTRGMWARETILDNHRYHRCRRGQLRQTSRSVCVCVLTDPKCNDRGVVNVGDSSGGTWYSVVYCVVCYILLLGSSLQYARQRALALYFTDWRLPAGLDRHLRLLRNYKALVTGYIYSMGKMLDLYISIYWSISTNAAAVKPCATKP